MGLFEKQVASIASASIENKDDGEGYKRAAELIHDGKSVWFAEQAEKYLEENDTDKAIACGVLAIYYKLEQDLWLLPSCKAF